MGENVGRRWYVIKHFLSGEYEGQEYSAKNACEKSV
jgi:hypothetical protein